MSPEIYMAALLAAPEADGSELSKWVLVVMGNIAIIIVAGKIIHNLGKEDWGKIVGIVAGACLMFGVITFPQQTAELLADIWKTAAEITA